MYVQVQYFTDTILLLIPSQWGVGKVLLWFPRFASLYSVSFLLQFLFEGGCTILDILMLDAYRRT